MARMAARSAKLREKPMPIMTAPQARVMADKWMRGPILRTRTVLGGWKMMYGMKKMRETMFWRRRC